MKLSKRVIIALLLLLASQVGAEEIKDGGKKVGQGFRTIGRETGQAFKQGGKQVGQGFKEVGKDVGQQSKKTGKTIGEKMREAGRDIKRFFTGK
jgi:hypothetical protein